MKSQSADTPPRSRGARGSRRLRLAVVSMAGAAAAVVASVLILNPGLDDRSSSEGSGITRFEAIACADRIVLGHSTAVGPGSERGLVTVTFEVDEWIKPARGPRILTFEDTPDPRAVDEQLAWHLNVRRLLYVPVNPQDPIEQVTDQHSDLAPLVASLRSELPRGLRTTCPGR